MVRVKGNSSNIRSIWIEWNKIVKHRRWGGGHGCAFNGTLMLLQYVSCHMSIYFMDAIVG